LGVGAGLGDNSDVRLFRLPIIGRIEFDDSFQSEQLKLQVSANLLMPTERPGAVFPKPHAVRLYQQHGTQVIA
jgi:hypothetical protein